jgi:hypothetical protein
LRRGVKRLQRARREELGQIGMVLEVREEWGGQIDAVDKDNTKNAPPGDGEMVGRGKKGWRTWWSG